MDGESQERTIHLAEYYHLLYKHKVLIIASLLISVALTTVYTLRLKPVYQSSSTIIVEKEQTTSPITGERIEMEGFISQSLGFNTHLRLITSTQVLAKTAEDLGFDREAPGREISVGPVQDTVSTIRANLSRLFGGVTGEAPPVIDPEERIIRLAARLRSKISVQQVRDTLLLRISAEDTDPKMARDIAGILAKNYIEFNIRSRMSSSQDTLGWMTDQLYEIKKKLEDAERDFLKYKENQRLFSIEGKQEQISQKMDDFNSSYLTVRNRRMELDTMLEVLRRSVQGGGDIFAARAIIENPVVENLYQQLLDAELESTRLAKVYKAKHPVMIQIQSRVENTRKKLREEIEKEVDSLQVERSVLGAREQVIQKTINDFEDDALDTNRKELQYTILKRNVETNQKLYDILLAKINESNIVKDRNVSNIRLVEPASLPVSPVRPDKGRNILMSIVFGLIAGIGLAFLVEYMDQSLRTEEDVQNHLGLPVLGIIPKADSRKA